MTFAALLDRLDHVTPQGSRHMATCPAHVDRSPSLQVTLGDKGVLLKCWAGCSIVEICASLRINKRDLFFDAHETDPHKRQVAAQHRARERHRHERQAEQRGTLIDALRSADYHIRSRHGLDISGWSNQKLDDELNCLADAYHLLDHEDLHG